MLVSAVSAVQSNSKRAFNNFKNERFKESFKVVGKTQKQKKISECETNLYRNSCSSYDCINEWKSFCIKRYEQGKFEIIA